MLLNTDQLTSLRTDLQRLASNTLLLLYAISFMQLLNERFDFRTKLA